MTVDKMNRIKYCMNHEHISTFYSYSPQKENINSHTLATLSKKFDETDIDIDDFNDDQIFWIGRGFLNDFPTEAVKKYANPAFNAEQMSIIYDGYINNLDVELYENPDYDSYHMQMAFNNLIENVDEQVIQRYLSNPKLTDESLGWLCANLADNDDKWYDDEDSRITSEKNYTPTEEDWQTLEKAVDTMNDIVLGNTEIINIDEWDTHNKDFTNYRVFLEKQKVCDIVCEYIHTKDMDFKIEAEWDAPANDKASSDNKKHSLKNASFIDVSAKGNNVSGYLPIYCGIKDSLSEDPDRPDKNYNDMDEGKYFFQAVENIKANDAKLTERHQLDMQSFTKWEVDENGNRRGYIFFPYSIDKCPVFTSPQWEDVNLDFCEAHKNTILSWIDDQKETVDSHEENSDNTPYAPYTYEEFQNRILTYEVYQNLSDVYVQKHLPAMKFLNNVAPNDMAYCETAENYKKDVALTEQSGVLEKTEKIVENLMDRLDKNKEITYTPAYDFSKSLSDTADIQITEQVSSPSQWNIKMNNFREKDYEKTILDKNSLKAFLRDFIGYDLAKTGKYEETMFYADDKKHIETMLSRIDDNQKAHARGDMAESMLNVKNDETKNMDRTLVD